MRRAEKVDVAVIGGGITGILLTHKLKKLGFDVILMEKQHQLASGSSTKNEGWLHAGTYHAAAIPDRETAIQVARRTRYGYEQIAHDVPEAVEDRSGKSYALIQSPDFAREAESRWKEAQIPYKPISHEEFLAQNPASPIESGPESIFTKSTIFQTDDLPVNTRLIYQHYIADAKRLGAEVVTGAIVRAKDQQTLEVTQGRKRRTIKPIITVHATGYGMKQFLQENYGVSIPMRFWKSHLLLQERLTEENLFVVDPLQATIMNHGEFSVVGLTADALPLEQPDFTVVPEETEKISNALRRLYRVRQDIPQYSVACVKVDMEKGKTSSLSLNVSLTEPLPNHFAVVPGKMTEAPYIADIATQVIYRRLAGQNSTIAKRPVDLLSDR